MWLLVILEHFVAPERLAGKGSGALGQDVYRRASCRWARRRRPRHSVYKVLLLWAARQARIRLDDHRLWGYLTRVRRGPRRSWNRARWAGWGITWRRHS